MSGIKQRSDDRIDIGMNLSLEERRAQFIEQITFWAANRRKEDALTRDELANLDSAQRLVSQKHALLDNFAHIYRQNPRADVAPGCLLFVTLFSDNNRGLCEYSMDRISRFFGRSTRAIQDAMKRLVDQDVIFRELRGRGYVYWPVVNRAFAIDRAHHGWLVDAMAPAEHRKSSSGVAAKHRKSCTKTPEDEQHHSLLRELTKEKEQNNTSREVITTQEIEAPTKTEPSFLNKSALPETLQLSQDGLSYAIDKGMSEEEAREAFEDFCDHHIASGTQMANWQCAWKKWVRNAFSYGHVERKRASKGNGGWTHQKACSGQSGANRKASNVDAVISELLANHDLGEEAVQWLRPLLTMQPRLDDPIAWALSAIDATEGIAFEYRQWAADEAVRNCQWRPALAVLRKAANWEAVRDKEDAERAAARLRWEQTSPESTDDDNFDRWLGTNERDLANRLICRTMRQGRTFNWHKREAA